MMLRTRKMASENLSRNHIHQAVDKKGKLQSYYIADIPLVAKLIIKRRTRSSLIAIYRLKTNRNYDFCSVVNCWNEAMYGTLIKFVKENLTTVEHDTSAKHNVWLTAICKEHNTKRNCGKIKTIVVKEDAFLVPFEE